jgi:transcriptional regulator GlxA family with amidase domain
LTASVHSLHPERMHMNPRRVGFLIYPAMQALDLVGPMDAFAAVTLTDGKGRRRQGYEVVTIGFGSKTVATESGLLLTPQFTTVTAPQLDTIVIPGGCAMRETQTAAKVAAWINGQSGQIRRIAAVCTGVYGLAATGMLDGRRVTTHWRYAHDLAQRYPALVVDADAIFLKDGTFYTSAGITAGIDLTLALIEEDYGLSTALTVARDLVVYLKRSGGQDQYSEPLQFQTQSTDRVADIAAWAMANLRQDLSVERLAAKANLGPRHFSRRFQRAFGTTPAAFVETLRIEEARRRLIGKHDTIERVALSVGFRSDDVFRRTFERNFGISPSIYRSRFGIAARAFARRLNP